MKFNIKKEKRCQYFSPDNASTALFSNALNKHIAYLNKKYEDLVLLCIGTDKITGDCLGPLVGSKLMQQNFPHPLYGTLEKPLHAGNLTRQLPEISTAHPNACTLAIDAAVGSRNHICRCRLPESHRPCFSILPTSFPWKRGFTLTFSCRKYFYHRNH